MIPRSFLADKERFAGIGSRISPICLNTEDPFLEINGRQQRIHSLPMRRAAFVVTKRITPLLTRRLVASIERWRRVHLESSLRTFYRSAPVHATPCPVRVRSGGYLGYAPLETPLGEPSTVDGGAAKFVSPALISEQERGNAAFPPEKRAAAYLSRSRTTIAAIATS